MRRIDVIWVGLGIFVAGGLVYAILQGSGLDELSAGIWSQAILVAALVIWLSTYVGRAVSGRMTYHQQLKDYETAVLQKRLDELSPEELAQIQAEIEQEQQSSSS